MLSIINCLCRWNDLWLNEGFATYVEYVGTNHAEPGFEMVIEYF